MDQFYVIALLPEYNGQRTSYYTGQDMTNDFRKAQWFVNVETAEIMAQACGMVVDILAVDIRVGDHVKRITPPKLQQHRGPGA